MAITAHFIDERFILQSFNLQTQHFPEKHSATNIKQELLVCFQDYNVEDKIVSITTDNGANVVADVQQGRWQHYGCYAHTINLIVKDSLQEYETKANTRILEKCRAVVHLFKASTTYSSYLKQAQQSKGMIPKTLKKQVPPRWNSTFIMLESIYKLKDVLPQAYLLKLSNIDEDGTKLKFILQKNVEKRIGKFDYNHNFQLASYLDPRFKHICIPDTELLSLKQRIVSGLKQQEPEEIPDIELTSVEPTASCSTASTITLYSADPDVESCCTDSKVQEQKSKFVCEDININIEIKRYEDLPVIGRYEDPLKWWSTEGLKFPKLKEAAMKHLARPATSVPSERVFSKSGQILSNKRSTKCMCLCIKYSSKKKTEITMEYLGIVELADCDAISLHRKLKNFLEEVGLPFNNLIRLGVDRASN
ncbi:E3 SUMO-protein ligase ZBED1-like [Zophobas morio]|uniref:E3 SUMO-protein ligase ZBED1-like n=1 Tax=Zophobas morio TaxID=2755281 RepID=UPI0030828295